MISLDALERRLVESYRQQERRYEHALALLAQADTGAEVEGNAWVQQLHELLQEVHLADAALADDKAAWRQGGRLPGADLCAVLEHLAGQVKALGERVDAQTARLMSRRAQILPRIDMFFRQQQMLQAYEKHAQGVEAT